MKEFRARLKKIIESMVGRVFTPGDIVNLTGLPRYEVLATIHVLETLGIIEVMNAKGNYRVYRLTDLGMKLLRALEKAEKVMIDVVTAEGADVVGSTPSESAEVTA